jgi:Mor family transcriptional regulator
MRHNSEVVNSFGDKINKKADKIIQKINKKKEIALNGALNKLEDIVNQSFVFPDDIKIKREVKNERIIESEVLQSNEEISNEEEFELEGYE